MTNGLRNYSFFDNFIAQCDQVLRAVVGQTPVSERDNPAAELEHAALSPQQKQYAASLMRINHSGEVCAQALYQGQALTARNFSVKTKLQQAAQEENDHLVWCQQRIDELGSHTSYLNPVWYIGSLAIGIAAGVAGDGWSLGFLAETERQVVQHLGKHLTKLSIKDIKSRCIVEQMQKDEAQHATLALESGAHELPDAIKFAMKLSSKIMTTTAYWV